MSDVKNPPVQEDAAKKPQPRNENKPPDGDRDKPDNSDQKQKQDAASKRVPRWPFFLAGIIVLGFVAVVLFQVFTPHPNVWTDDAYVMAHYSTVSPRISGQVASVDVSDNEVVHAGQVLVTLDPRDNRQALAMAQAELARDSAQVNNRAADVARQPALIIQQQAALASAQARLSLSELNRRRYSNLAASGAGTTQERQTAEATAREDEAAVQNAQAALDASHRQLDVLKAQQSSSEGTVQADQARVDQARLNLSYTQLLAPLDGMVGQKTVQVGNTVAPGAVLMAIVPLDHVYIEANFREEDLRHVRRGQHVTIHVDAYNIDLDGIVDSVPPATGATFAMIPPNNATGNFTKIVQRLPVKIEVAPGQPLARLLRVGFSVETTIHTENENVVGEQADTPARVTAHQ